MVRTKTAVLNLRIEPDIKTAAEKAAADDRRSLTSLVEKLLLDYLRDKGYLPETDAGASIRSRSPREEN